MLLRHTLATLAYRAGKALLDVSEDCAQYRVAPGTRTPAGILAHMCDLMDWALALADGRQEWRDSQPQSWNADVDRFFAGLKALDHRLASAQPLGFSEEKLFQGPVADALTHIGQIAMLRRLYGNPVRGENYFRAEIAGGRVGREQAAAVREFE